MNACNRCLELVSAHLEGETSPAESRFLESHLPTCPECRRSIEEVRLLLSRLESLPRVELSPDFTDRVLARTHGLRPVGVEAADILRLPRRSPAPWAVPLAAAAALAVIWLGVRPVLRGPTEPTAVAGRAPAPAAVPLEGGARPETGSPVTPPEVVSLGGGEGQSLGMVRDTYILGTYELRATVDGSAPILTRASVQAEAPVTITF